MNSGKSKGRVLKRGKVTKPASRSTKRQSRKVTEKASVKVSKSKGANEKVNEDMETAEATISHLKTAKKRDKVRYCYTPLYRVPVHQSTVSV